MQKSLFSSASNAGSKASIFKPFVNEDGTACTANQAKAKRIQIRKYIDKVLSAFAAQGNTLNEEQTKDFLETYSQVYLTNDFSVASIYNGSDDTKKEAIGTLLNYLKPKENAPKENPKKGTKK